MRAEYEAVEECRAGEDGKRDPSGDPAEQPGRDADRRAHEKDAGRQNGTGSHGTSLLSQGTSGGARSRV
ncbi:hypothetical protein GCM10017596_03130 [Microbacterium keratanolyticum]|uniref:Uncharacterized protein n=1 Tax=Microbacterium keratanolyticum TaxID=67574 RepID=A0A9W6HPS4_9MICO|nr:hypothetical protein GCM10017596_03130 [Microbacterium keratanolyticum]